MDSLNFRFLIVFFFKKLIGIRATKQYSRIVTREVYFVAEIIRL